MLDRPARGQGVAGWEATVYEGPDDPNSKTIRVPVYLTSATEGVLWRLAHQLGDTEPILPDLRLGVRYRLVKGLRAAPWCVLVSIEPPWLWYVAVTTSVALRLCNHGCTHHGCTHRGRTSHGCTHLVPGT